MQEKGVGVEKGDEQEKRAETCSKRFMGSELSDKPTANRQIDNRGLQLLAGKEKAGTQQRMAV